MLSIPTCQSSYHLLPLTVTPSRLPMYYHVSSNPFYFKEFEPASDPFPPALSMSQLHIMQAEKCWPVRRLRLHRILKTDASLLQAGRKGASSDAEATWLHYQHNAEAWCNKPDGETEYISWASVSAKHRQSKLTSVRNLSGSSILCLNRIIPPSVLLAPTQTEVGTESFSVCFLQMNLLMLGFCQRQHTCMDGAQHCSAVPPFLSQVPGLHLPETLYTLHLHLYLFSLPARDYFLHCYLFPPTENQLAEPWNNYYQKKFAILIPFLVCPKAQECW